MLILCRDLKLFMNKVHTQKYMSSLGYGFNLGLSVKLGASKMRALMKRQGIFTMSR